MIADTDNYTNEDITKLLSSYGITVDGFVLEAITNRLTKSSEYYEKLLKENTKQKAEKYSNNNAMASLKEKIDS